MERVVLALRARVDRRDGQVGRDGRGEHDRGGLVERVGPEGEEEFVEREVRVGEVELDWGGVLRGQYDLATHPG